VEQHETDGWGPNVGLLNAENCARFYLCEAATLDDALDLQSEMGLELLFRDWGNQYRKTDCRWFFARHTTSFLKSLLLIPNRF
jgi:hypothetical protein